MKLATLEAADQGNVAEIVRRVVLDRGAEVSEATRSHVRFRGLHAPGSYEMRGYVGTHQRAGEPDLTLRYEVHATLPARLFWRTVGVGLLILVVLFLADPGPGPWFPAVLGITALLAIAFVVYLATWRSSRLVEDALLEETLSRVRQAPHATVPEGTHRAMEAWEAGLRADLEQARSTRGPFSPEDRGTGSPEEEDALRQRLQALREELERRRGDQG